MTHARHGGHHVWDLPRRWLRRRVGAGLVRIDVRWSSGSGARMRAADPEWVSNPLRHAADQGLGIGSPKSNNEPITKDTNPRHGKERKDNE